VGTLQLTPQFTPNRTEYYATWTQGVDPAEQTVAFETSDPDVQARADYMYLGVGPAIYIWEDPPYKFDGRDTPAVITITVEKGESEKQYKVYVNGVL
jgi:hypothetical protein